MKIKRIRKRDLIRAGFWLSMGMFLGMFLIQSIAYLIELAVVVVALTPNIPGA